MALKMTMKWIAVLGGLLLAAPVSAQEAQVFKTQKDKMSYVVGVDMAKGLKGQGIEVEMDLLIKGLQDGMSGGKLLMSDDDFRKAKAMFHAELRRKQNEMRQNQAHDKKIAAENNKKAGEAFLAENKTREGVVTLSSGLQYKILKAGDGRKPTDADMVKVNYRGTLINGAEFDSSQAGRPTILKVTGVISGLKEALKLMPIGSRWQLFIPPALAYGTRGIDRTGPNATLLFEIELLAIK